MGYALAILAALVLLALAAAAVALSGHARRQRRPLDEAVGPDRPAADAPTPDRSATAPSRQVEAARRRTPPS